MKRLSTLFVLLAACLVAAAQSKLTPQAMMRVASEKSKAEHRAAKVRARGQAQTQKGARVALVVKVADGKDLAATVAGMKALGARVQSRLGRQVVVSVPLDSVEALSRIEGVARIDVGHKGKLKTDVSRRDTRVSLIDGTQPDAELAYTGKGVTVCVIDNGFDFQHPAFKDSEGRTRIKAVYMMSDEGGPKFVVHDEEVGDIELPGSVYDTSELIARLTTDNADEEHGTHTSGIAAGSRSPQGFGGMAPEADLVLIALSGPDGDERLGRSLRNYDDEDDGADDEIDIPDYSPIIENAFAFAEAYAEQSGLPMVISASLNTHNGPHDGSSTVSETIEYASTFAIPVFSTGNEGGNAIHAYKHFTALDNTVRLVLGEDGDEGDEDDDEEEFIRKQAGYGGEYGDDDYVGHMVKGGTIAYCRTPYGEGKGFSVAFSIVDGEGGEELWRSEAQSIGEEPASWRIYSNNDGYEDLHRLFEGSLLVTGGLGEGGKISFLTYAEGFVMSPTAYIVVDITSDGDTECDFWEAEDGGFVDLGLAGFATGSSDISTGDWTSGEGVISVGAYCANTLARNLSGEVYDYAFMYSQDDIAYFSSYGQLPGCPTQPLVCAPGVNVVSSVSHYNVESDECAASMTWEGFPYNCEDGTSMACPTVSGIVALWLEACPTLTFGQVRDIIAATARTDSHTALHTARWGSGKIDAKAGLDYVLEHFPTGISAPSASMAQPQATFDLQGRRVACPASGLYIVGGRKIFVK